MGENIQSMFHGGVHADRNPLDGASRSTERQAVPESAARREHAVQLRRAVLRMDIGADDGINVAAELTQARDAER
jgi:hypothetical protein